MTYSVNLWGSNPDDGNDDCWCGENYPTLLDALVAYQNPEATFSDETSYAWITANAWIEIDGPDIHEHRELPAFDPVVAEKEARRDARAWQREQAMQLGMGLGVDAYNDAMGW